MKIQSLLLSSLLLCMSAHAQTNPAKPRTDWNFDDAANLDALPRVPEGFSVTMFAREPLVRQPCSIAFDARGRMFVGMGPQYRNPTPQTPPDSVVIVRDTDGDGVADQTHTFATGFNCVQGLAWHGRDLWVANAPDLTIVRDLDGDDVADEYVRVFTDIGNIEHALHGLNWAPDGRLYMTKGNSKGLAMKEAVKGEPERIAPKPFRELAGFPGPAGTPDFPAPKTFTRDSYRRTYQDPRDDWGAKGGVLRCDDLGANLEIVSRGLRNPYGMAFDHGFEWLGTDQDQNEGDRLFMPFFSADFGWSHAWSTHWTGENHLPTAPVAGPVFTGSGTGVIYADSPAWPAAYRGVWLINDWLLKSTQLYRADWKGALLQPAGGKWQDFISAKEARALYRPVDMAFGADGALYILGWSRGYGVEWDKDGKMSNEGRIYRIMPTGAKTLPPPSAISFAKMTVPQLLAEFDSLLPVRRIDAQDELARLGKAAQPELITAWKGGKLSQAQETWTLWALMRGGAEDDLFAGIAADASSPLNSRLQALRILGQRKSGTLETVFASALSDKEPRVRFAAVQAVHQGRLATLTAPLIAHAAVEKDRVTYYATWHALRDLAGAENLRPLLADTRGGLRCAALLALLDLQVMPKAELHPFVHDEDERVRSVAALGLGIGTRPDPKAKPAAAPSFALATKIVAESGRNYHVGTLSKGQPSYSDRNYTFKQVPEVLRGAFIIRTANEDDHSQGQSFLAFDLALESTVIVAHDTRIKERPAWLRGFADTDHPVITDDSTFHLSSKDFPAGKVVLGGNTAAGSGRGYANYFVIVQPKPLIPPAAATSMDAALAAMPSANPRRGEALFFLSAGCASCHRVGNRGINFGPDLTNLGERLDAKFILQAMLEPNAVITEGFSAHVVEAVGKSYFGMLLATGQKLTLGLASGETVELAADTITKHETLPVSPMPAFSALLGAREVADVTAWLLTQKSAPPANTTPPTADGFHAEQRADSLAISWRGRAVGDYVFRDTKIPRPYFAGLHAPDGTQVTRNFPPVKGQDAMDHDTLHPGLALAFGDLNGVDFWRNKGRIEHGRIVREPRVEGGRLSFAVEEKYLAPNGTEICRGVNEFCFIAGETLKPALPGTLLMWSTTLRRADGPLIFGPQHEMGLSFRIATPLVVKGGSGSIVSSHGGKNEAGNWGRIGMWWDYSGTMNDRHAGILAVAAADNARPVWSHARDYGFLAMNPTGPPPGEKDVPSLPFTVPAGESLRMKFGVLLHSSAAPLDGVKASAAVSAELEAWKTDAAPAAKKSAATAPRAGTEPSATGLAAEFHVDAARGSDAGDGSRKNPWRTLRVAAQRMGKGATCVVHGGTYRETCVPQAGQSFVAAEGEVADVTGGDLIREWRQVSPERPVFVAEIAAEVRSVFFRGQHMDLARHPNHRGDRLATDSWAKVMVSDGKADRTAAVEFPGEKWTANQWVGGVFCGVGGDNGYSSNYGLITSSADAELRIAKTNFYLRNKEFQGPGHGYITRHLRALDAPGEWHWENGKLYFWPPDGKAPGANDAEAQVRLWGCDLTGCERVTLRGLRFRGASVLMENARGCVVERCIFRHHAPWSFYSGEDVAGIGERHSFRFGFARDGTSGLHVSGSDNVVRSCDIAQAWGGGVSLLGDRNAVEDCLVEEVGWLARQDVAPIWVCGDGHRVEHCTVRRAAGMGICATQFGPLLVKRPRIVHNRISDVGLLLVDSGSSGIYLSNHDAAMGKRSMEGGVIAWNHISGVQVVRGSKGFGIYLDDGTDHAIIHHNVVDGGGRIRWGIFIHYAQHFSDNLGVYHNTLWGIREQSIFAGGRRDEGGTRGFVCRNNLVQRGAIASVRGEIEASDNRIGATVEEFVNVEALDFQLRSRTSPAVDAGVVTPGINNEVKDGKPDIGAYEFNAVPWSSGSSLKRAK